MTNTALRRESGFLSAVCSFGAVCSDFQASRRREGDKYSFGLTRRDSHEKEDTFSAAPTGYRFYPKGKKQSKAFGMTQGVRALGVCRTFAGLP